MRDIEQLATIEKIISSVEFGEIELHITKHQGSITKIHHIIKFQVKGQEVFDKPYKKVLHS
jgi:hypothetical protein